MKTFESELLTEALLSGAPAKEIGEIISENYFKEERRETEMEFLYLIEQWLDDNSVYAFQGWDEGIVLGPPHISKFWVEVDIAFPKSLDLSGAKRLFGKEKQNKIKVKEEDSRIVLRIKVLRSILDTIEQNNRVEAKSEAEDEGYRDEPQAEAPAQQPAAPMGVDPMMGGGMGAPPGPGMGGPEGGMM